MICSWLISGVFRKRYAAIVSLTLRIALGKEAAGSSASAAAICTSRSVRRGSPISAEAKVWLAHSSGFSHSFGFIFLAPFF